MNRFVIKASNLFVDSDDMLARFKFCQTALTKIKMLDGGMGKRQRWHGIVKLGIFRAAVYGPLSDETGHRLRSEP